MRESTSWNQANGSTPLRLQEAMKLGNIAAVLPPVSLPKNVQLPRPSTISRLARSVAPGTHEEKHRDISFPESIDSEEVIAQYGVVRHIG